MKEGSAQGFDLQERLIGFAVRVISVVETFDRTGREAGPDNPRV